MNYLGDMALEVRRKRKLCEPDLQAIADLMAKRLTQSQACLLLGIKPKTFDSWLLRNKNSAAFAEIFQKTRAATLNRLVSTISDASVGQGIFKGKPDWRAANALLSFKFRELVEPTPDKQPIQAQVAFLSDALSRVFNELPPESTPKAINNGLKPILELSSGIPDQGLNTPKPYPNEVIEVETVKTTKIPPRRK